ncbi:Putative TrmH family tRNA/rRNA methyltransferase [Klebsiella pneumoniae]|nr:Putative TrmH family tRNA/rRNA methyltransferase [Klebsiella pneumoniae]
MLTQPEARILILESLQDPGNTGTIIRTAEALGYDAVFYNKGTVDIYNTKVLRSMQGSHFHIPVIKSDVINLISLLKKNRFRIYGSSPGQGSVSYRSVSPEKNSRLLLVMRLKGLIQLCLPFVTEICLLICAETQNRSTYPLRQQFLWPTFIPDTDLSTVPPVRLC